jgi:polyhydroxybutyrate depolymerase
MRAVLLLLCLTAFALAAPPFYTLRREAYVKDGVTGGYYLRHPRRFPSPYRGLVVVLHGIGGPQEFRRADRQRLEDLAGAEAMLVAYPEAPRGDWRDPAATQGDPSERALVLGIADELIRAHSIPPDQVFWIGVGPGGRLAMQVAALHPDRARAAAIFGMGGEVAPPGPPPVGTTSQVPLLFQRGTEDPLVPFRGGPVTLPGWGGAPGSPGSTVSAARVGLRDLARARACGERPEVWTLPDRRPRDGVLVRRVRYDCPDRSELVLYEFFGGGHGWPGCARAHRRSTRGRISMDYAGADLVWGFFVRHGLDLRERPDAWEGQRLDHVYGRGHGDPEWFPQDPWPRP